MSRPQRQVPWKIYSLVTGFAADVAALAVAVAMSSSIRATPGALVMVALVLGAGNGLADLAWHLLKAGMQAEAREGRAGVQTRFSLGSAALGGAWLAGGLAIADHLISKFSINGFWPYVGTLALLAATNLAVYLPLHVARRMRA